MRATTRACAAAAGVQRPLRTGTIFSSAQRLRVDCGTPERRAASVRLIRSSATWDEASPRRGVYGRARAKATQTDGGDPLRGDPRRRPGTGDGAGPGIDRGSEDGEPRPRAVGLLRVDDRGPWVDHPGDRNGWPERGAGAEGP